MLDHEGVIGTLLLRLGNIRIAIPASSIVSEVAGIATFPAHSIEAVSTPAIPRRADRREFVVSGIHVVFFLVVEHEVNFGMAAYKVGDEGGARSWQPLHEDETDSSPFGGKRDIMLVRLHHGPVLFFWKPRDRRNSRNRPQACSSSRVAFFVTLY